MALAATLFGPEDLRMVERPLDPLASGMVRIRFGAGGICGSERMHYYRHARTGDFVVTSPLVLGHEIAGEVVEIAGAGMAVGRDACRPREHPPAPKRMRTMRMQAESSGPLDHAQKLRPNSVAAKASRSHLESPMY